ncbi:hypothetical protein NQ317_018392 [Molorchus minor]|uniref:EndoU domain-containing protein n=1 Tax=Molorchus minor TaxID=1323400 RepID=A0ABQ9J744_9CUCU|nr:hypothetical protein NQ317_018392 [Molorchus minor]
MQQELLMEKVSDIMHPKSFPLGDVTNLRSSNNAWSQLGNTNKNVSFEPQLQSNGKSTTPWPALGRPRNSQTPNFSQNNQRSNTNRQSTWTRPSGHLQNTRNAANSNVNFLNSERGFTGSNTQNKPNSVPNAVTTNKNQRVNTQNTASVGLVSNPSLTPPNKNVPNMPPVQGGSNNNQLSVNAANGMKGVMPTGFHGDSGNNPQQENKNTDQNPGSDVEGNDLGVEDYELREFSEELITKDINNAARHVTINLQGKTTSRSMNDEAPLPLLSIDQTAYNIPSIEKLMLLYNNYILEASENEVYTAQEKIEENNLLDTILSTPVMQHTRNFLIKKGKLGKDPKDFKDLLRLIWFNMYSRGGGRIGSSGFEHIFLAELKNNQVSGLHNWLYFNEEESKNRANYLGYLKKIDLGNKGVILKYHFTFRGVDKPVGSMFIGTSPELEIALYSACFILRADKICPLKMNGNRFIIRTYTYRYRGKNMIGIAEEVWNSRCKESNFYRLVTAYREHAHKYSNINPVAFNEEFSDCPELDIKIYGFTTDDKVQFRNIINSPKNEGTIREAKEFLIEVYGGTRSAEFLHLESAEEIEWLCKELEELPSKDLDQATKTNLATELLKSQCFDNFLAKKILECQKIWRAAEDSIEQIVLAMPHRGRLNLLTGMLNFPPVQMFSKLGGNADFPPSYQSTGDVLSHCISSTDLHYGDKSVHVSLLYNPSHLEAVNPVSMGKTRGKQMMSKDGDYGKGSMWGDKVINVQVHGDAAIIAQGVNQECLELSGTPHFQIGGSIHLVVNNQLGFTTPATRGRSSRYCTDLAKMISAPVFHVNGDYPEDVLKITKLAFDYQRKFRKEVFIDLNCYRQWGHNEMDDPTFTNPALYSTIRSRGTVPDLYAAKLATEGILPDKKCKKIVEEHYNWLTQHLEAVDNFQPKDVFFKEQWDGYVQPEDVISTWDTGIDLDLMTFIGSKSVKYPPNFEIHPTLLRAHVKSRLSKVAEGTNIDWSTAEALAIGSLLFEGYNVRISGQDVGRGTFSQRHAMLVDQQTNNTYIPLNSIHPEQTAFLEVANSILSEEAVLGFEYGMSIEDPKNLVIWEAQFGDFFNGAQIIFDTFISSAEDLQIFIVPNVLHAKWLWQTGLTILLPHGYDGAGPEHSSCRLERFLQLTDSKENKVDADNVNMQVCQLSTLAQYFHLLRRQMKRNFRKPLIVVTPKILLRHPACDRVDDASNVNKILLTSGKHYYSLLEQRDSMGVKDTAIVRVEGFCPFPTMELRHQIGEYPNAKEDIAKFMKEAPDEIYLLIKVVAVFGLAGACRREELNKLTIEDIDDKGDIIIIVTTKDSKKSFC